MRHAARMLAGFVLLLIGVAAPRLQAAPPTLDEVLRWRSEDRDKAERTVFLGCQLTDAEIIELSTNLASSGHPGVFLLDSVAHADALRHFFKEFKPSAVVPVGAPAASLDRRLEIESSPGRNVHDFVSALFRNPGQVVLVSPGQRDRVLQGAFLAGTLKAPFYIAPFNGNGHVAPENVPLLTLENDRLSCQLHLWLPREIFDLGAGLPTGAFLTVAKVHRLGSAATVAAEALKQRSSKTPFQTLVVANPQDGPNRGKGDVAALAPWLALQKRGLLLLTNEAGTNVAELVKVAVEGPEARRAEALLLVGNLKALPTLRRDNPLDGKDEFIEMEPLTPEGHEPASFATGRLFHDDLALVTLMAARPRLWRSSDSLKAVVVSNPGGGLPFLETFSRNTAQELSNAGFEVTAFYNKEANRAAVRAAMPEATFFLWEGHHSTLVRDYEAPRWTEPMRPGLVFLQSCLALAEDKAQPFLERGAIGAVGSTSRNYSGSGGALSLAYVDALLYDQQTLGGALRSAKNFLLAFALLKEKRFGADAKMNGASLRTAWSFSLWGDPTLELPRPQRPEHALPPIRHQVKGNAIIVTLPVAAHDKVVSARYQTQMLPNARLAGLISKNDEDNSHPLVPLIFQEVHLPKAPAGKTPKLHTRLPDANWVFCWDARRTTGYLLIRPRAKDTEEIRFHVDWQ